MCSSTVRAPPKLWKTDPTSQGLAWVRRPSTGMSRVGRASVPRFSYRLQGAYPIGFMFDFWPLKFDKLANDFNWLPGLDANYLFSDRENGVFSIGGGSDTVIRYCHAGRVPGGTGLREATGR